MATGDIREIDMTKATNLDGKKIRLVGDDGKGYWIEKEDLAAVVGGLFSQKECLRIYNKAISEGVLYDGVDLNDYKESKNLFVRDNITNSPDGSGWWYVEIAKFIDPRYIVQRATSVNRSPTQVWSRSYAEGNWYPWTKLG